MGFGVVFFSFDVCVVVEEFYDEGIFIILVGCMGFGIGVLSVILGKW